MMNTFRQAKATASAGRLITESCATPGYLNMLNVLDWEKQHSYFRRPSAVKLTHQEEPDPVRPEPPFLVVFLFD